MSKNRQIKQKIIVIVGPTASGKTMLSIKLAKKFDGEVISADSRQVYIGLDVGTEKITKEEMCGIPHHLIDVIKPSEKFSVQQFKELAEKAISDILKHNKLPIITGGTGFYIQSIVDDVTIPRVLPNEKLRIELESKTSEELFNLLKNKDQRRAEVIDKHNKRRLVRALEIIEEIGSVPEFSKKEGKYDVLQIGIQTDDEILKERISSRLNDSLIKGLINETKKIHESGIEWDRINEFGLEYKIAGQFLRGEINENEMITKMKQELWQYARRQKMWFKRDKRIKWFTLQQIDEIEKEVEQFLTLD